MAFAFFLDLRTFLLGFCFGKLEVTIPGGLGGIYGYGN